MNIFYTNEDPRLCSLDHCYIHMRKMIVEYCQLLSTAHRLLDGKWSVIISEKGRKQQIWTLDDPIKEQWIYKASHVNHPSAKWIRASKAHYLWLVKVVDELLNIYHNDSGKTHKLVREKTIDLLRIPPQNINDTGWLCEPYIAINKDQYGKIYYDYQNGFINLKQAYQQYLDTKYGEWLVREDKRPIHATWPVTKPSWVTTV